VMDNVFTGTYQKKTVPITKVLRTLIYVNLGFAGKY
jgi:hypothetical protein